MGKDSNFVWPEATSAQVKNTLQSFLESGESMPQAYLFLGKFGGKELAQSFSQNITGQPFPNVDTIQFDAGFKTTEKSSEARGVEAIREVLQLAALMPVLAPKKVVVLENMDQASPQMHSALLKTLEEPPKHAIFMLLSNRPLIATVMSRCQVIILPQMQSSEPLSPELAKAMALLESNRSTGLAERLALVNTLAALDDELLPELIEQWMHKQTDELKQQPQKFAALRISMETLQALRGNFNKKMVLQNFVISGLT